MQRRHYLLIAGIVIFFIGLQTIAPAVTQNRRSARRSTGTVRCGIERWPVKIGTDTGAGDIDISSPTPVDIQTMRDWDSPFPSVKAQLPKSSFAARLTDQEKTCYVVHGFLKGYKIESGPTGDSDFHIVLRDEASADDTLIVEIPHPSCAKKGVWTSQITKARQDFESRFTPAQKIQWVDQKIPVTVTGIAFFDRVHGQDGVVLKNGIEIHPVLSIDIGEAASW
ncbi:MAG TPA: hypothetical protein VJX67_17930 [Blastocatellia bacterium]|nr:hypothetical protein [Blastocatellia bacterium]